MNFLAHLYLSGNDPQIMIGNFIADHVKGKSYLNYNNKIQQGILLHRKIDEFTDKHAITKELALLFRERYKKHSGIVVDILYDHFLSINWPMYSDIPIDQYIKQCHRLMLRNLFLLPSVIKGFLPVLIARKRLLSYSKITGIENALHTMSKYTSLPDESSFAIQVINENFYFMNEKFKIFFKEICTMAEKEIQLPRIVAS